MGNAPVISRYLLPALSGAVTVFCSSKDGAGIAFADLTVPSPVFVDVLQLEVEALNPLVAAMMR